MPQPIQKKAVIAGEVAAGSPNLVRKLPIGISPTVGESGGGAARWWCTTCRWAKLAPQRCSGRALDVYSLWALGISPPRGIDPSVAVEASRLAKGDYVRIFSGNVLRRLAGMYFY